MSKAFATGKAWETEDLSHRDVPLITRPVDCRCHHNGLLIGVLNLNCVAASFGHRPARWFRSQKEAAQIS